MSVVLIGVGKGIDVRIGVVVVFIREWGGFIGHWRRVSVVLIGVGRGIDGGIGRFIDSTG